jgi:hypothetical protein
VFFVYLDNRLLSDVYFFFFYHFVAWLFILLTLSLEEHMSLILMRTSLPILSFVNYVIGVKDMV